jgi:hypothetical protein
MKRPPETPLLDPRVLRVVGRAPHAYVTIETASGPHVTPLLFAITATRLWFVMARTTLKVRVLRKRPAVGIVIDGGRSVLVVRGEASVLDPLRPRDLAAKLAEVARAPLGGASYGLHNPLELMSFARDAARVPGRAQPNITLVSVQPQGIDVVAGRGTATQAQPANGWRERLPEIPELAAALVPVAGPAVLALLTPEGPFAVPVQWDPASGTAVGVRWPLVERAGAAREGAACLCLDGSHGKGPIAKHGVLLRGAARITGDGDDARAELEPDRVTWWDGFDTGTAALAPAP